MSQTSTPLNTAAAPTFSNQVNVAFMLDNNFVEMALVAIYSMAKNTVAKLNVYIIDCGITSDNKLRFNQLKQLDAIASLHIKAPERYEAFEKASRANPSFPSALFYRLCVHRVFPELERVLVLDSDLLFLGDVAKLFNEDLHGTAFGVMNESEYFGQYSFHKRLPFSASKYFNIGVLLVDCKRFEELKILERVLEVVQTTTYRLVNLDQDALNLCIHDDEYQGLSPIYNFLLLGRKAKKVWRTHAKDIMIVHYAGLAKPYFFNRYITRWLFKLGFMQFVGFYLTQYWHYADEVRRLIPLLPGSLDILRERPTTITVKLMLKWCWKMIFQPLERFMNKCFKRLKFNH